VRVEIILNSDEIMTAFSSEKAIKSFRNQVEEDVLKKRVTFLFQNLFFWHMLITDFIKIPVSLPLLKGIEH